MEVLERAPYSYVLLDDEGTWILTFLLGGPVERDVSVRLTADEVDAIETGDRSVDDLVATFRTDPSAYDGRRVMPPVRPTGEADVRTRPPNDGREGGRGDDR